jgi:hypothetical protein
MSSSPSTAATLRTIRCSAPGPARGELNATTSPVNTALKLGRGRQRMRSLSTVLAVLLLLLSDEALLGGLIAFALRVGAMAAPAGHACQGQLTLTGQR